MAAAALDSPGVYAEYPYDQEDVIYPCKACGEILEEGKAYELAGNRWHIDCFRCNTCGTLLDSDANLLLLGDGSLICNNCTYSCNACGNKIEDLAILTGDQAFCSGCFRCRNCKRKIENLRYARTSQGIFCMSCHESLMARRRKKSKSSKTAQNGAASTSSDKALPSLPRTTAPKSAFSPDLESPPTDTSELTNTRSPPDLKSRQRKESVSDGKANEVSPRLDDGRSDAHTLPSSTYGDSRSNATSHDSDDGEEQGYLPMAFDPNPAPILPPSARRQGPSTQDPTSPTHAEAPPPTRDYFGRPPARSAHREIIREEERPDSSRSLSGERRPVPNQEKNGTPQDIARSLLRDPSTNDIPAMAGMTAASGLIPTEKQTTAQTAEISEPVAGRIAATSIEGTPETKKVASRANSQKKGSSLASPLSSISKDVAPPSPREADESPQRGINPFDDPRRRDNLAPGSSGATSRHADRPVRGDSLAPVNRKGLQTMTDPSTSGTNVIPNVSGQDRKFSAASIPSSMIDAHSSVSREAGRSKLSDSPHAASSFDSPPPRSSSRPGGANKTVVGEESSTKISSGPLSASIPQHRTLGSVGSLNDPMSPSMRSPTLPKDSLDGTFSMEEEMSRILKGDVKRESQTHESGASVLRKVSNAVKHGRSFSDRGLSSAGKASANGVPGVSTPVSISSPILSSFSGYENQESLLVQLRRAHQRIAELEAANAALQEKVDSSSEIKAANNELREKRTTIVVLDTQREMAVRELEVMTDHLAKAKNNNQPLDLNSLKGDVVKDLADSLEKLKEQMSLQIEDLMHKRNELTDEIGNLIQMKDKGFQEYENLSTKNAQLLEMNSQILHNIQEMYKSNRGANGSANGLGIYSPSVAKPSTPGPSDVRNLNLISTDSSMPSLLQEIEAEPATVLTAPQVVNIRKAQPKRFNWRRGGEKMAKNVTKGIKGAFGKEENGVYGQNLSAPGIEPSVMPGRQGSDAGKFGFFGQKAAPGRPGIDQAKSNSSSTNLVADASVLFGSELEARCEYEKRVVPAIVSRCIEEVESRGMEMEGIYRKSGGSGQVKTVQQGFEKDGNYEISDPDLDIHAVTSALKQYFRKLPTPLVTYDVYELLLDAGKLGDHPEQQLVALRGALAELPEAHRNTLEFLFQHLSRVVACHATNLMTPLNIAVVFAPTIMRPLSIEREMTDIEAQRNAVKALLENCETVFAEDEE